MGKTYGSGEIQQIAKITRIQAVHWTEQAAVIPFKDAKGRGGRRVYSWQNLIEFMICRELNRFSIETYIMTAILTWLRVSFQDSTRAYIPKGKDYNFPQIGSYWDFLKNNPKTDKKILYVFPEFKYDHDNWCVGVTNWEEFGMASDAINTDYASILGVNIRKFIEAVNSK